MIWRVSRGRAVGCAEGSDTFSRPRRGRGPLRFTIIGSALSLEINSDNLDTSDLEDVVENKYYTQKRRMKRTSVKTAVKADNHLRRRLKEDESMMRVACITVP